VQRILAGTDATVRMQLLDGNGEPAVPASAPDVTVVDAAGDEVTGSPFSTSIVETDVVEFTLPAAVTSTLGTYTASASAATAGGATIVGSIAVETVGGFLFGVQQLRDRDPNMFEDAALYTDEFLRTARTAIEERLERAARRAFVPRARRITSVVDRRGGLSLPDIDVRAITAVVVDGAAVDVADVELTGGAYGTLRPADSRWIEGDPITVAYEFGLDTPPHPVVDAAITFAREAIVKSALPARATSIATEEGTFRITVAGRDGWTGIPEVDVVLRDFGRSEPAVG